MAQGSACAGLLCAGLCRLGRAAPSGGHDLRRPLLQIFARRASRGGRRRCSPRRRSGLYRQRRIHGRRQAEAQAEYYASIGGDPLDVDPLEPIVGDFVSFLPGTLPAEPPAISGATGDSIHTYIYNKSSGVFHLPGCSHIDQMNPENRGSFTGSREEAAALYTPCKDCDP